MYNNNLKLFNKTRKEKDNPNYLIYIILLLNINLKIFNKTSLDKSNDLILLI